MLPYLHLPFGISLPVYGLCMLVGTVVVLGLAMRWAGRRGISRELIVELAIAGLVFGILGARLVFLVEQWEPMFADRPPGRLSPGPLEPLAAGDALVLRTRAGEARVAFRGDETDARAVVARIIEQASAADVQAEVREKTHRGPGGLETAVRGFVLRTGARGDDAVLEVVDGPAARKLGLQPGVSKGQRQSLARILNLRDGGLTYFGSVIGVLASWLFWLRRKRQDVLGVLDAIIPAMPVGLFFGRLGCLAKSCCWGREASEGTLLAVQYPRGSLPWLQMAEERLPCTFDPLLRDVVAAPRAPLPEAMERLLGPLAERTPALHNAQMYEGLGVLVIAAFLVVFRDRWQTRVGQTFLLTLLLQAPLRFVVEHLRRDHDVFLTTFGYPLTETQTVALLVVLVAGPLLVWVTKRGRPDPLRGGAPA